MRHEGFYYQRIYQVLAAKIETGLYPPGSSLPSCATLCKEYEVSAKTIRRVLSLLSQAGLIQTTERKRAVVAFDPLKPIASSDDLHAPNPVAMADILKTAQLLCFPMIWRGLSLCRGSDWSGPQTLVARMDPHNPSLFWRTSKLFWRFFVARCENELALCLLDSLGFLDLEYNDDLECRMAYRDALARFVEISSSRSWDERALRKVLSEIHSISPLAKSDVEYTVPSDSPFRVGISGVPGWMKTAEDRYTGLCLDILGLIAQGRYGRGDKLPSHAQLQEQYGVSVATTLQAIRMLKEWGVVHTVRSKGIFVSADLQALQELHIPPALIAGHVRTYLESAEFLSLTIEGVARYATDGIEAPQIQALVLKAEQKSENACYMPISIAMLECFMEHLPCGATKQAYSIVLSCYRIGEKLPKLVCSLTKAQEIQLHNQYAAAIDALLQGERDAFARQTAQLFTYARQYILDRCGKLGYLQAAQELYNSAQLWK